MLKFRTPTLSLLLLSWPGWAGSTPEPPTAASEVFSAPIPEIKFVALRSFHNLAHPGNKVRAFWNQMSAQPRIEDEKRSYFKDYVELISEHGDIFFYDILFTTDKDTGIIRFKIDEADESRAPKVAAPKNTKTRCPSLGKHPTVGNFYKVIDSKTIQQGESISYPFLAKFFSVSKQVTAKVFLDATGAPTRYEIVQGHPLLNEAVLTFAKQCRYSPALINDSPIASAKTIVIPFHLKAPQTDPMAQSLLAAPDLTVKNENKEAAYEKSVELWKKGDHQAAALLFGRIAHLDPDFRLTRFYLALDALDRDQQKTAWDLLKAFAASKGMPGTPEDRIARGATKVMMDGLGGGSNLVDHNPIVQGTQLN